MLGIAPLAPAAVLVADSIAPLNTLSTLAQAATAPTTAPAPAEGLLPPVVILAMCVIAGVATVLLLPGRREHPVRKLGGAILLAAALIVTALLVRELSERGARMGVYFWAFSAIALVGAVRVVTHPRPVYSALYFVLTVFATAGLFILLWAEFMAAALVLIYAGAILVTYVFVIMLATSAGAPEAATGAPADLGPDGSAEPHGNGNHYGDTAYAHGDAAGSGASAVTQLAEYDAVSREPMVASAVGFALMGILLFVIFDRATGLNAPIDRAGIAGAVREEPVLAETSGSTQKLGVYLFQNHMVNLELAGLLLTVSMIGAIIIARRRIVTPESMVAEAPVGGRFGAAAGAPAPAAGAMSAIDDDPHAIPVYGTDNPRQKAYPET